MHFNRAGTRFEILSILRIPVKSIFHFPLASRGETVIVPQSAKQ
jgi:hypothetical protein